MDFRALLAVEESAIEASIHHPDHSPLATSAAVYEYLPLSRSYDEVLYLLAQHHPFFFPFLLAQIAFEHAYLICCY